MSLFKRGKTWWVDFTTPAGERVRQTAETTDRNQAQEYHDKLKAEAWRVFKLGDRPNHTWDEAAHRWLMEKKHLRSYRNTQNVIAWWHEHFRGMLLRDVTREVIQRALDTKAGEWAPGTVKRNLEVLGAVLHRAAKEWEWLDHIPRLPQYPKVQRRVRWLTPAEAQRLLQHLPEATAEMARFALATGLRRNNVLRLEWSQVDMERRVCWIYADQAKAGKDIHVSLNSTALAVLERQRGKHDRFVFVGKRGRPQTQIYAEGWRAALKAAGIDNFRWHDLRHTWASWLAQEGTPLHVLQEMGGWADYGMVLRYAHLTPERFATHASVVDQKLDVTFAAQP